jgi:gluconokinase
LSSPAPPTPAPVAVVLTGPAGSGKTTVGRALAERLGWPFVDGDTLHPARNIAAMAAGKALTDDDRSAWLDAVAGQITAWISRGTSGVIACSALKRSYRTRLAQTDPCTAFVFLRVPREVLVARVGGRRGHFMPVNLVDSQLETLEEPTVDERVISVDGTLPAPIIIATVIEILSDRFGGATMTAS